MSNDTQNAISGIALVPEPSKPYLNEKQELDYRSHRRDLLRWCLTQGKKPAKAEGYSEETIRVRAGHIDRFYRWVWSQKDRYTTHVTHDVADQYMDHLAFNEDMQTSTKAKYQKSLKMLWKWREHERDGEAWDPDITFAEPSRSQPREYLTLDERRRVREAIYRWVRYRTTRASMGKNARSGRSTSLSSWKNHSTRYRRTTGETHWVEGNVTSSH